jgi:hypothetical protein
VPSTATLELYVDSVLVQTHTVAMIADALHHWAITYSGSVIRVWVDGTLRMTQTATVLPASSTGVVVRYENYGELYVGGVRYWDNEHYTAAFTPPTQLTL